MNEIRSEPQTPDELLRMMEIQLASARGKRERSSRNRIVFRVGAILVILGGCLFALLFLQWAVSDLRRPDGKSRPAAIESASK